MFLVTWRSSDGWEYSDGLLYATLDKEDAIQWADNYDVTSDDRMKLEVIECNGTQFTPIMEWPYLSLLGRVWYDGPDIRYTHVLLWVSRNFQHEFNKINNELYASQDNALFLRIKDRLPEIYVRDTGETISLLRSLDDITALMKERFNIDSCLLDSGEYYLPCKCLRCKEHKDLVFFTEGE